MARGNGGSRAANNNRSNQMNPNNAAYHSSREGSGTSEPALDNNSQRLNPDDPPFHGSCEGSSGSGTGDGGSGGAQ